MRQNCPTITRSGSIGYGYSCNHVTFYWYVTMKIVYKIRLCPKDAEFAVM